MTDPVTDPSRPSPEPRVPGPMLQDGTTRLILAFSLVVFLGGIGLLLLDRIAWLHIGWSG